MAVFKPLIQFINITPTTDTIMKKICFKVIDSCKIIVAIINVAMGASAFIIPDSELDTYFIPTVWKKNMDMG